MTEGPPRGWQWRPAPGWPVPSPVWRPPPGWQPDPSWPAPPENWEWWAAPPNGAATAPTKWFIAAGVMVPLAMLLLVVGLGVASLALVYLSIVCSIAWLPLLVIGLVKLARSRRVS